MGGNGQSAGAGRTSARVRTPTRPRNWAQAPLPRPQPQPQPQRPTTKKKNNGDVSVGDVANFGKGAAKVTDANIDRVRRDLGQTGMEAGHLGLKTDRTYIGTGRAYNINQYIRTDGKEYKTDQSPYWNDRITPQQIVRDIRRIDAGMKGLKQDTQLFRFERGDMLGNILANAGLTGYDRNNIGSLIQQLKGDPAKLQTFANILRGRAYVNKGYNSFSYLGEHPGFAEYDVQIRIVAKAGTKVIATINKAEHEFLGGHHLQYNFTGGIQIKRVKGYTTDPKTGIRKYFDKDQIIIDATVENTPDTLKRIK